MSYRCEPSYRDSFHNCTNVVAWATSGVSSQCPDTGIQEFY
ncbi:hypothetical protein [Wolbachia endosymbiont of Psylliodes chrysocephala]|nr:hypothetical protein [Wolbachia endosymbiont of Psylliodes chrysocephala]